MDNKETFMRYRGRIVGLVSAIIFSLLFLTVGLGYAIAITIFVLIGFLVGKWFDRDLDIGSYIEALFDRRR
ncbi:DUF2273 domain-containing protein [Shouchella shacheensis]|uniref:DUF2273 domain-containing protein n=1 Tax=Shouchella shacheensis TaxID=1649580 RepID=UPI000740203D|nr:DUF2273 domain-containing protein [Shouchella shacheensis]